MKNMFNRCVVIFNLHFILSSPAFAFDEKNDIGIDDMYYKEMVTIASGYLQETKRTPSNVTVITQQDIERIGALTIEEVLKTIPGIHVSYANGFLPTYNIRGISSSTNSQAFI